VSAEAEASQTERAGPLHWIVAVLAPCLILWVAWTLTGRDEGAGLSEDARQIEASLHAADPEVVLIGASTAGQAVGPKVLGTLLSDEPVRVGTVIKGSTMPPVWYVLAKERVFGAGLRPRLLVVAATPRWLMETAVVSRDAEKVMAEHMTEYDPVVAEKAYGQAGHSAAAERITHARVAARSGFQDLVREWSVGAVFGEGEGSIRERGRRIAEPALAGVFGGEGSVDLSLKARVIPVVEAPEQDRPGDQRARSVADSFVPDLVALAQSNGARIVFVWLPYPPRSAPNEELPPAVLVELVRYLNQVGAGWLDLHDLGFGPELFYDPVHMNAKGRERFTVELARALREIDALGTGPLPAAPVPFFLDHQVRREGTPATLQAPTFAPRQGDPDRLVAVLPDYLAWSNRGTRIAGVGPVSPLLVLEDGVPLARDPWAVPDPAPGTATFIGPALLVRPLEPAHLASPEGHFTLGWSDDLPLASGPDRGWWVYPGTSLVVELGGPSAGAVDVSAGVVLEPLGAGEGAPVAQVLGTDVPLTPVREALAGEVRAHLPAEGGAIRLTVPTGGPTTLVRWLHLDAGDERIDLMGSEALTQPVRVNLLEQALRGKATVEGRWEDRPLDGFTREQGEPVGVVDAPEYAFLSNTALAPLLRCTVCTPLRLLEDGQAMQVPSPHCKDMFRQPEHAGRVCQEGDRLMAFGLDGSVPGENGRSYSLTVVPDRKTQFGFWVVPGDCASLPAAGWQVLPLRHGATALALEGHPVGEDPGAALDLALEVGAAAMFRTSVPLAALGRGPVQVPLDEPLLPGGQGLTLRLCTPPEAPFVMLTRADLEE